MENASHPEELLSTPWTPPCSRRQPILKGRVVYLANLKEDAMQQHDFVTFEKKKQWVIGGKIASF